MKHIARTLLVSAAMGLLGAGGAQAANVTVSGSVVMLATNGTQNYVFKDPATAQSVTVAVTLKAYSASDPSATFSLLDPGFNDAPTYTHLGVDGNLIVPDPAEGLDVMASLVSVSSGVTASSVQFRVAGLGLRAPDNGGSLSWSSSAGSSVLSYTNYIDSVQTLDNTGTALNGATYAGHLRVTAGDFQLTDDGTPFGQGLVLNATFTATGLDPQLTTWITTSAGKYARIYLSDTARTNGTSVTTWTNTTTSTIQALPAYCGVQEIDYSTNWIYVRTTDLADYTMGPWYNDASRTTLFIAFPTNQHVLYVLPRTATLTNPPSTKTVTYGPVDAIGYFVNGVAMFDALDGWVWNGSSEQNGGSYQWRRAAYPNEAVTFDPGYSHQPQIGEYHNHADPIALRYTLGDHVNFDPVSKIYSESTNPPTQHSPILGWVRDGLPLYGPYGYSNPTNANSGVRRMVSGYQLRNAQNGADNLSVTGRSTLPAWMLRNNGNTAQSGPSVNSTYPLGRYLQDYAYLGDLTNAATGKPYQLGVDFDLNEFDARWCVTPEFPNGTWAYFVPIDTNGTPIAPWNVGMFFFGSPTGTKGTSITEAVTTNFIGAPYLAPVLNQPNVKNGTVVLSWSATEGGSYRVESTTNFITWTTNATGVAAVLTSASSTNSFSDGHRFFRVAQTGLAPYDPVSLSSSSGGGSTTSSYAPGGSVKQGTVVTVTITLPTNPPHPPANAPITSVTLAGTIHGTSVSDATAGTVIATFDTTGAPLGAQSIVVVFANGGPTYTITPFTIN